MLRKWSYEAYTFPALFFPVAGDALLPGFAFLKSGFEPADFGFLFSGFGSAGCPVLAFLLLGFDSDAAAALLFKEWSPRAILLKFTIYWG